MLFWAEAQLEAWIILNLKLKLLFSKLQYQYQDHLAPLLPTARLLETGAIFCPQNDNFTMRQLLVLNVLSLRNKNLSER